MLVLDNKYKLLWNLLACVVFFKTFLSHGVSALLFSLFSQSVRETHHVMLVIFQNFPIDMMVIFCGYIVNAKVIYKTQIRLVS